MSDGAHPEAYARCDARLRQVLRDGDDGVRAFLVEFVRAWEGTLAAGTVASILLPLAIDPSRGRVCTCVLAQRHPDSPPEYLGCALADVSGNGGGGGTCQACGCRRASEATFPLAVVLAWARRRLAADGDGDGDAMDIVADAPPPQPAPVARKSRISVAELRHTIGAADLQRQRQLAAALAFLCPTRDAWDATMAGNDSLPDVFDLIAGRAPSDAFTYVAECPRPGNTRWPCRSQLELSGSPLVILFRHARALVHNEGEEPLQVFVISARGDGRGFSTTTATTTTPTADALVACDADDTWCAIWVRHAQRTARIAVEFTSTGGFVAVRTRANAEPPPCRVDGDVAAMHGLRGDAQWYFWPFHLDAPVATRATWVLAYGPVTGQQQQEYPAPAPLPLELHRFLGERDYVSLPSSLHGSGGGGGGGASAFLPFGGDDTASFFDHILPAATTAAPPPSPSPPPHFVTSVDKKLLMAFVQGRRCFFYRQVVSQDAFHPSGFIVATAEFAFYRLVPGPRTGLPAFDYRADPVLGHWRCTPLTPPAALEADLERTRERLRAAGDEEDDAIEERVLRSLCVAIGAMHEPPTPFLPYPLVAPRIEYVPVEQRIQRSSGAEASQFIFVPTVTPSAWPPPF